MFFSSFFGHFKCILAKQKDHIENLLFKSSYKLCTPIWAILLLNASTDPPKNRQTDIAATRLNQPRATSMKNVIGRKKSDFGPFSHFFCKFRARHIQKKDWEPVKWFWPPKLNNLKFAMLWPQLLHSITTFSPITDH